MSQTIDHQVQHDLNQLNEGWYKWEIGRTFFQRIEFLHALVPQNASELP